MIKTASTVMQLFKVSSILVWVLLQDISDLIRLSRTVQRTYSETALSSGHQEVVQIAQCLLTINIQRLLCTVIKFHVIKEAIQSSSSLPFITNVNFFQVNAKTLTDFSTYFKDVIQFYYCPVQSGVRLIEFF